MHMHESSNSSFYRVCASSKRASPEWARFCTQNAVGMHHELSASMDEQNCHPDMMSGIHDTKCLSEPGKPEVSCE